MTAIDRAKALIFTGGVIPTSGASAGDLAAEIADRAAGDNSLAANIGKIFPTRQIAVDAGQSAIPATYARIATMEGGYFVIRGPGQTEDQLFASYPNWGVVSRYESGSWSEAVSDLQTNTGKTFVSRQAAVDAGQENLPPVLGPILVRNGDYLEVRGPGQTTDQLFTSYPNWGILSLYPAVDYVDSSIDRQRLGLRDSGTLSLINIGGTGDAITADLHPTLVAAGIDTLSTLSQIEYIPSLTNAAANPTITIGGVQFDIRRADGGTWQAEAFVVGRTYILRRRGAVLRVIVGSVTDTELDAEVVARSAGDNLQRLALRDSGTLSLNNVGGTGDAITAEMHPTLVNAGITSLSTISEIEYIPTLTNSAPNPTITIDGVTFDIRRANGSTWQANAFVTGRTYKLRRRQGTLRVIAGSVTEAELDQAGVIRLVGLSGTADAFTATAAPGLEGQAISNGRMIRWRAIGTSTVAGPAFTIDGVTRQVRDTNNSPLPAGGLLDGRTYLAEIISDTAMCLVYASDSATDIAARIARMDANDAKWADRSTFIEQETPEGYTVPASTAMIVTTTLSGDYMGLWRKSGDQGNPPAEGRVLTANDGYWIRIGRYAKNTLIEAMQAVIDALKASAAGSMQAVVQRRAALPDRPFGAAMVMWRTWDDPSAKMSAGIDLWAQVDPAPVLTFADTFDRADEPLAADNRWVNVRTVGGVMSIVGNAAQPSAGNALPVVQSADFLPPDQFIEAEVLGGGDNLSSGRGTFLYVNMQPGILAGYCLNLRGSQLVLQTVDEALNYETLAATPTGFLTYPLTARLERDGNMLRAYINGVEELSAEATKHDGGMVGIGANATTGDMALCRIESVTAGVVG